MMYTGALRWAFHLPVANEIEPKAFSRRLWLPLYSLCVILEHVRDEITVRYLTNCANLAQWDLIRELMGISLRHRNK